MMGRGRIDAELNRCQGEIAVLSGLPLIIGKGCLDFDNSGDQRIRSHPSGIDRMVDLNDPTLDSDRHQRTDDEHRQKQLLH